MDRRGFLKKLGIGATAVAGVAVAVVTPTPPKIAPEVIHDRMSEDQFIRLANHALRESHLRSMEATNV
jgi:hypothetical protein